MPTLKRTRGAALVSPPSPTPSRIVHSVADKPLLRASLRHWREGPALSITSSESDDDLDAEDVGMSLFSIKGKEMAEDSDDDNVDASLASLSPGTSKPKAKRVKIADKGKGVDRREYGNARPAPSLPSQSERVLKRRAPQGKTFLARGRLGRRIPSTLNLRDPRRIVSPTESIFGITNRIHTLATDEQDEQDVSSSLFPADGDFDLTSPTPMSPGAASGSDTETEDPVSPLASKSRRTGLAHRRRLLSSKNTSTLKRKMQDKDEDRADAVRALETLATAAGFKLVPMSPKLAGEPMDADTEVEIEFAIPSPVRRVRYDDDQHMTFQKAAEKLTPPTDEKAKTPTKRPTEMMDMDSVIVHQRSSEKSRTFNTYADTPPAISTDAPDTIQHDNKPARILGSPFQTPRPAALKRKADDNDEVALAELTCTRQRYNPTVPLSKPKEPVTPIIRHKRCDAVRMTRSTETAHLQRKSPTSLIPSRVHLRKARIHLAHRPVVLYRPKRQSNFFSWDTPSGEPLPVLAGPLYATVLRETAVVHRVRHNLLKRYRERVAQQSMSAFTPHPVSPPNRSRSGSTGSLDDEEVEHLLPSGDVEMHDSEMVDAALSPRKGFFAVGTRPAKRAWPSSCPEVASRRDARASLRAQEQQSFADSVRFHIVSRREKRQAVKAHVAERVRAEVMASIAAVEERRAEEAELARLATEAQVELDAELARRVADADAEADAEATRERRLRLERIAFRRRRAADSVAAHLSSRPRTRLGDYRRRRPDAGPSRDSTTYRGVTLAFPTPEPGPSRWASQMSPEPEIATTHVPRALLSPVQIHVRAPVPVPAVGVPGRAFDFDMDVVDRQATEDDDEDDEDELHAPPRYEYPFFPIVRAAPPAHFPESPVTPPRRRSVVLLDLPDYEELPRRYTSVSPSPPPPYNAHTDRDTVVHAVFTDEDHDDSERERERDREINVGLYAAMHAQRFQEASAWEHPNRAPPEPVVVEWEQRRYEYDDDDFRTFDRLDSDYDYGYDAEAQNGDRYSSAHGQEIQPDDGRPIISTLRRWLGW